MKYQGKKGYVIATIIIPKWIQLKKLTRPCGWTDSKVRKTQIVTHFTLSTTMQSAYDIMNQDCEIVGGEYQNIFVPYILGRDGTVWQIWEPYGLSNHAQ